MGQHGLPREPAGRSPAGCRARRSRPDRLKRLDAVHALMRAALLVSAAALLTLAPASGSAGSSGFRSAVIATFTPSQGHHIAGFALDREWLALAEDPDTAAACPVVRLAAATGSAGHLLTR